MRPAAALAVVALAASLAAAPAAHAGEIALPGTRAVLDLPAGWTPIEGATERGLVAGYRGARGMVLAVTRAGVPNTDAYRKAAREAYADQIERGIAGRVDGYRRIARRLGERHGTPALDLEARRRDGATIVVRVLLFWTYALALAIEVPPGEGVAAARAIAAGFGPPAPRPPAASPPKR
ncbi:MAG TPA: hypothetical protein VK932_19750 [Kofleriaceae bacterium]|nr:hypothetical protein [Kofleriaceae bacterium]